jgi:aromatic ring-opening dioxygenase catalytic subunit (LigB family)
MSTSISRRDWILQTASAGLLSQFPALASASASEAPSVFVYHGSPATIANETYGNKLQLWGKSLRYPRGIIAITPHVRSEQVELGQIGDPYTLYSFPGRFKPIVAPRDYVPPNNAALAVEVESVLSRKY